MHASESGTISPAKAGIQGPLVWLGPHFFSSQLPPLGWELVRRPHELGKILDWENILELTDGRPPGAVLVADASIPPHVVGIERFPCPTILYAVDSHIHSWLPHYAQGFDVCLVSLKDDMDLFTRGRLESGRVWWSPPYAREHDRPPAPENMPEKEWPLLFVGTVDPAVTPERFGFMEKMRHAVPGFHITRGDFGLLYPKARIILNEASRGDLNFRVFEALGCGACLISPRVEHGLTELFADGEDLFLYPAGDAAAAAALVERLLADPVSRRAAEQKGLAKINAAHRASHRARAFSDRLLRLLVSKGPDMISERLDKAALIHSAYLRLMYLLHAETMEHPDLRRVYAAAARGT